MAGKCPRAGFAILEDASHKHVVQTKCKTWGCVVCRKTQAKYVGLRGVYGLLMGEHCSFITTTYRMRDGDGVVTAKSAGRDHAELWKKVRKWAPQAEWMRVPEMTKRGQVHMHHLVNGIEGVASCQRKRETYLQWKRRECQTSGGVCIQHRLSEEWGVVNDGVSYVVDVSKVRSKWKTGWYLVKYLVKGMDDRRRLEAFGYKRRWAASRGWPKGVRTALRGTVEGRWIRVGLVLQPSMESERELSRLVDWDEPCRNLEQVGTDMALELARKMNGARIRQIVRRISNGLENTESRIQSHAPSR